jgi:electron transfer flavoprotein alpha/beta subunit
MPLGKASGAQFEISVDGKPRSYRDRKAVAIEAAEHLKRKHPNSEVVVRDLASGEAFAVAYKSEAGALSRGAQRALFVMGCAKHANGPSGFPSGRQP